ncbi:uncharacterized protein LOC125313878 [Rhodamnia argentea]|uniref:Uncharacterized protein LOC125313878 n=1 Tax=Rhodamnia argentea TaxID=178133 RepID=A0ABM3H2D7_9MYRT|nr:uncharacterized protein LOC125313878 [Rhodamnia argentea]XP_048130749.1 uncharacterized protein LOC125313878 [Rhodamnia argentea]
MKRKKWSELEEQTLLTKYSELSSSGALAKLKTREKKFKPIAEHVNAAHHLQDPTRFPFKWSWRDVSIKVQNMRHQYLGVKQKIRASSGEFNWDDGENHWENFLRYKEVFGDVELEIKGKKLNAVDFLGDSRFGSSSDLGLGFDLEDDDDDDDDEEGGEDIEEGEEIEEAEAEAAANSDYENADDDGVSGNDIECDNVDIDQLNSAGEVRNGGENGGSGVVKSNKFKSGFVLRSNKKWPVLGAQVIDLRDAIVRREERRREIEFYKEKSLIDKAENRRELEFMKGMQQSERLERLESRELELDKRELIWARREIGRRSRLEREFDEERRRRRRMEEKREEEEMEWRGRMIELQVEHEKAIMQMQADACQNQMQILGVMARMVCQFFGSASDALSSGLSGLPPQVLQNLQHPAGLDDSAKPETNSPSEFI